MPILFSGSRRWVAALFAAWLMTTLSPAVVAESTQVSEPQEQQQTHKAGVHHANTLGIFAGVTHAGRRKNGPALGLSYERRLSEAFGIGAFAEYTFGDADLWVFGVPFAWHTGHWKLFVAPGFEDGHHGTEGLVRLGAEYVFEMSGGWELAPAINVDFVGGDEVWIFGVAFIKGF